MTLPTTSTRLLATLNESAVLRELFRHGRLTIRRLGDIAGLTPPTISSALQRLIQRDLVRVVGHDGSRPGRKAAIYAANPAAAHVCAVQIRPTSRDRASIVAVVSDLAGDVVAESTSTTDLGEVVESVENTVDEILRRIGVAPEGLVQVCVGVPGLATLRPQGIRELDRSPWFPPAMIAHLSRSLRLRTGMKVAVRNHVQLAAVTEAVDGVATGVRSFALLWMGGDQCELSFYQAGEVLEGVHGRAGQVGGLHEFDVLSGEAILQLGRDFGLMGPTPAEVVVAAGKEAGWQGPKFLEVLSDRIAASTTTVSALLDPALIVLGGDLALAGGPELLALVADAIEVRGPRPRLMLSEVRADPDLRGALLSGVAAAQNRVLTAITDQVLPSSQA